MSQPPASSSMSNTHPTTASPSKFMVNFESALRAYEKTTKKDLTAHPLIAQLQRCDSPAAILTLLQDQVNQLTQSRSGDEKLQRWLNPTINVLYAFSATLSEGVGLVFTPANVICAAVGVLLLAAKDVEASQDGLVDIFERIENFFRRLESYVEVPSTPAMKDMEVKIMVEVLDILGTATMEVNRGRTKKYLKKMAGITKLEDSLKRLDKMTQEFARMAAAMLLKITHSIDAKVQMVISDGKETIMRQTAYNVDDVKRMQLREDLKRWQSPADPSINDNIARKRQYEGTTEWFFQGSVFDEWRVTGSLLWIHGKPGSGKSVLCSAIIKNIATLCEAGSASMAYFYFDLLCIDKRSRYDLLPSLLVQFSARSDSFCDVLCRLYKAHDNGARRPSDGALVDCLKEMLILPDQGPVYIILDALDECPNTSGVPSAREQVLDLVKELVGLRLSNLHICVTSRTEDDIRDTLESLVSHSISLHDESGQKYDIANYVTYFVNSDRRMMNWRQEDKKYVIETLLERADGMFRWVYSQLETLRRCFPSNLRRTLNELPASPDETYERVLLGVLKEIGRASQHHAQAYRLLQCLTVAIRPLRVEELAEILAFDFDEGKKGMLDLKKGWRWKSQQEAILSTCSSFITVVNDGSHHVVQFSHVSVKEFLTSERLATSNTDVSRFHILLEPAHTIIAKVCLGILLRSDNIVGDAKAKSNSPLAKYAAEHWVEHAQFEKCGHLQVTMQPLFDPAMPYFESWLDSNDFDQGWDGFTVYGKQRGSPLYYASLCGFRDLVAHLVTKHPQHVNATLGLCHTPLAAALYKRHFDIAELLCQHDADVGIRGYKNRTLLHAASVGGFVDIARWLLSRGVDVDSQQDNHETPLHLASSQGRFEIVLLLLDHGAEVTSQDREHRTPLHLASSSGSAGTVLVLIRHGADVNARDGSHNTPLHLASSSGSPETVRLLVEGGAEVTSQGRWHRTPLHLASSSGSPETVQALIELGADVDTMGGSHDTPLHLASSSGSPETVRLLIKLGAVVNAMGGNQNTPLHLASSSGSPETVRVLLEHGADVNAIGGSHNTPLHLASSSQSPEIVRLLIENGAKVTSQDRWQWTPLHLASSLGSPETVQVLIKNGAVVNARDGSYNTPLHLASSSGSPETVQLLIEHGTEVDTRDGSSNTPLHLASFSWSPDTVRVLLKLGADVNAKDGNSKMPLHLASSSRSHETVRILIEHGADFNSRDGNHNTPLHLVSSSPSPETVQLLIMHGADVNTRDGGHNMPLHLALSSWRPETVRLLLEKGAEVNARDGSHKTPLHLASSQPEDETFLKFTEIQCAKSDEKADIMQVLIQHGADVTARDNTGLTPLHLASSKGSAKTVKLLLRHGADVNAQDEKHSTPLHLAASALKGDVVHLLLSHAANVYAKDDEGRTPFQIGSSKGIAKITELVRGE